MARKPTFKTGGDMMEIVAKESRKPAPKNGAFGLGTWENALGASRKAPRRR